MPTVYLALNRKTRVIVAASALLSASEVKASRNPHPKIVNSDSQFIFTLETDNVPRELQRLINTLKKFRSEFGREGVTFPELNKHRAHLSEKRVNPRAAVALATVLDNYNTASLLVTKRLLLKYLKA